MGHKVNPVGLRLGINRTWDSRWFAGADYSKLLHEDLKLRDYLRTKLRGAGVSRVVIERPAKKPRITIYAARPGVVAGREDVIVGGALVLSAVMERFSFAECLVSESDILDGLIASQRP